MGIPSDPLMDILRRSLVNLEFIESNYKKYGLYEVTQLVNTFMGAFIHPFEKSQKGKSFIESFSQKPLPINVKFKILEKQDVSYYDFLFYIRNALAHGNLRYNANSIKQIESIDFWNKRDREKIFRCTIHIKDMKTLLEDFASELESLD